MLSLVSVWRRPKRQANDTESLARIHTWAERMLQIFRTCLHHQFRCDVVRQRSVNNVQRRCDTEYEHKFQCASVRAEKQIAIKK